MKKSKNFVDSKNDPIQQEDDFHSEESSVISGQESAEAIASLQEQVRRVQADYQNLQRRTVEERAFAIKFANKELFEDLVQPLEHLAMAANELKNPGLNMVIDQLWKTLEKYGLKELQVLGKPFNVETMEAIESDDSSENGVVKSVVRKGYEYQGKVLQHAKVVIGKK